MLQSATSLSELGVARRAKAGAETHGMAFNAVPFGSLGSRQATVAWPGCARLRVAQVWRHGRQMKWPAEMPMALSGRCIMAYFAARCRCTDSDYASKGGVAGCCGSLVSRARTSGRSRTVRQPRRHACFDHGQWRKLAWKATKSTREARPRCALLEFRSARGEINAPRFCVGTAPCDLCPLIQFQAKCSLIGRKQRAGCSPLITYDSRGPTGPSVSRKSEFRISWLRGLAQRRAPCPSSAV